MLVSLEELRAMAANAVRDIGEALSPCDAELIRLGVAASVTSLDRSAIEEAIARAFASGATPGQIQEVVSLVSGLGVHSLMVTATAVLDQAKGRGLIAHDTFTPDQQVLWNTYVGEDPFWNSFEKELPGFLRAMLLLSPDQFMAFFTYCAVPWKSGQVRARLKELIAMACDATPMHRFMPGFRLHLANAITLGAGQAAIDEALDIAAAAPMHSGTR